MNNKGQVLVMFILLIPLIFLLFGIIIDVGLSYTEKRKLDNTTKMVLEYGLNNIEKENIKKEMNDLLKKNINKIEKIEIKIEKEQIVIHTTYYYNSIFTGLLKKEKYEITSKYKGYKENGNVIISKE